MSEGLFITRVERNQLMKKISYLEEFVRNSMRQGAKSEWVKPAEAMELIGCKKTKLEQLRTGGILNWRYAGKGKGGGNDPSQLHRTLQRGSIYDHHARKKPKAIAF